MCTFTIWCATLKTTRRGQDAPARRDAAPVSVRSAPNGGTEEAHGSLRCHPSDAVAIWPDAPVTAWPPRCAVCAGADGGVGAALAPLPSPDRSRNPPHARTCPPTSVPSAATAPARRGKPLVGSRGPAPPGGATRSARRRPAGCPVVVRQWCLAQRGREPRPPGPCAAGKCWAVGETPRSPAPRRGRQGRQRIDVRTGFLHADVAGFAGTGDVGTRRFVYTRIPT